MVLQFDDFVLDAGRFEVTRNGEVLSVEPKVFSLLAYLIENRDRLITKDELVEQVWEGRAISDWTLTGCVKSARQLLDDTAKEKKYIKTVHGKGFRFLGDVIEAQAHEQPEPRSTPVDRASVIPVVAILPFDIMSIEPDQDYLADGICDDIITILGNIPSLRVIARNSTFQYKGRLVDMREAGRELGASHILEGSIRCVGTRVRISVQLIETQHGTHSWAEQYDREMSDVFELQDEIARQVVSALHIQLVAGERAKYWARGTQNFEAWKLQLRATQLVASQDKENGKRGRALAEQAAALDPDYSEPWATLGISYVIELMACWDDPPDVVLANALQALDNAIERDPENPLALATLGVVKSGLSAHDEGFADCARAYELGQDSFDVVAFYILSGIYCGRTDEVKQAAIEMARHGDALEVWHLNTLAFFEYAQGNFERAVGLAREAVARQPDYHIAHNLLAMTYPELGDMDRARQAADQVRQLNSKYSAAHAGMTLAFKDPDKAARLVACLRQAGLP